jgi:L-ascorbate metabolism protein UlaG (beta-lactamase superfamily)
MQLQLLRNATLRLNYAGRTILVDPCLGAKGSLPTVAGIQANPTVDLPVTVEKLLQGVELTVISHLHPDHFDPAGISHLPKTMPILCHPAHLKEIEEHGFTAARTLTEEVVEGALTIAPTTGQHGTGEILAKMGTVMGFILKAENEPTVYWAGDTVLTPEVIAIVRKNRPDVIVTHSGAATLANTLLLMDDAQTIELYRHAGEAIFIAVHMEAFDHCAVTRDRLRATANLAGIPSHRLLIPADGEQIEL